MIFLRKIYFRFSNFIGLLLLLLLVQTSSLNVRAHSGNLDSSGCHNDNIHGGYHCHGGISGSTNLDLNLFQDTDPYVYCYGGTCPIVTVRKSICPYLICCNQTNTLIAYSECLNLNKIVCTNSHPTEQ